MRRVILALCLFAGSASVAGQSNVPLESPRGNYEGAENIHWYQQRGLRESDNTGLPPRGGDPLVCGEDDGVDCFGVPIRDPQVTYFRIGASVVKVALLVDSRKTNNFNFRWRRATDAIRRANDAFARSGVNARLSITSVQDFDFDAGSYPFDAGAVYDQLVAEELEFIDNTARDDEADAVLFIRNAEGSGQQQMCGVSPVGLFEPSRFVPPIVVLTCEDGRAQRTIANASLAAAHEFGHTMGLAHEAELGDGTPFVPFGAPFISPEGRGTIMNSGTFDTVPFFSSPLLVVGGELMGNPDTANAVQALNQAATTASLFWERRWGGIESVFETAVGAASARGFELERPVKRGMQVPRAIP